ncbi:MAG: class I poly(R)-hydroxyalkanoic acid synthase [Proteobacteria bacterium]|nr:class I poly(R)-hydroxyalkanoic acid synthase [Pseudomonadota bacterium]NOG59299.1 class I poly(R)-hydroxyalkanoic acid synthase [Pseudomonadota bacterium]
MCLDEINEHFEKAAQSNISMTNEFINSSLDAMSQANPFVFNSSFVKNCKSLFEKNIAYTYHNLELFNQLLHLNKYSTLKSVGLEAKPVTTPDKSDRRFSDEDWNENVVFDHIKQLYLILSKAVLKSTENSQYEDEHTNLKIDFYTKQFLDAMSPTNFITTNPAVIKETIDKKGENLVNGAKALVDDIVRGKGKLLTPRMTDYASFEVGKNVATTPGKVIFQNELMQLLQYTPTTKTVFETPLLIVPPWINKYYILDLRKENSFIQWAVDQGHTVFIISWKNPDESYADTEFEDYMLKGVLTALDKIKEETGVNNANTIGYCIGGTLLAATNAYLATKRRKPIKSCTYFTTMVDFEEPGDLGIFIDNEQLDALDATMEKEGYLDGSSMASVFNMLRSNDLIWPFFINNYLMGKEPTAFDLLYWNSDSTRLPEKTHSFYLRNCYLNNLLREPGGIELDGTPIDLSKIKNPTYFISTKDDHITPWKSTYSGAKLMSGSTRFVLGGSGHIAGIINPPVKNKYGYWTNNTIEEQADDWLENANYTEGSWWPDWQKWVKKQAGKKVPARKPGKKLKPLEDAPGSYVKHRIVED